MISNYSKARQKSRQIDTLIQELQPLIKNVGDATVIVPLIKDYLEVSVKNDDALVKLAAIVQRLVSANSKDEDGNEFGMTDEERRRLIEEAEEEIKKVQTSNPVEIKTDKIKDLDGVDTDSRSN
jgi:hypothetical protein